VRNCSRCGCEIPPHPGRGPKPKYCSARCRDQAKWARLKSANPCPECGGPMSLPSRESAEDQRCRTCRTVTAHGTLPMYEKRRCRCGACRDAKARAMRVYAARRKDEGRPVVFRRPVSDAVCPECGASFMARPGQTFCSTTCAKRAQGWDGVTRDRWRPSVALRRQIIVRDEGVCQLCRSPVREDVETAHPRYPHIDHIVPRARGGADDESNLRLLCAQCNVTRGARIDWVPEVVHGDSVGRLEAAV
jgi:hypothetical protein